MTNSTIYSTGTAAAALVDLVVTGTFRRNQNLWSTSEQKWVVFNNTRPVHERTYDHDGGYAAENAYHAAGWRLAQM